MFQTTLSILQHFEISDKSSVFCIKVLYIRGSVTFSAIAPKIGSRRLRYPMAVQ